MRTFCLDKQILKYDMASIKYLTLKKPQTCPVEELKAQVVVVYFWHFSQYSHILYSTVLQQ